MVGVVVLVEEEEEEAQAPMAQSIDRFCLGWDWVGFRWEFKGQKALGRFKQRSSSEWEVI